MNFFGSAAFRHGPMEMLSDAVFLLAFAGETDHLVPEAVARRSVELVASKDKEFRLASGGHMGVIIGGRAQKAVWRESADWLAERSSAGARKARAKGKAKTRRAPSKRAARAKNAA